VYARSVHRAGPPALAECIAACRSLLADEPDLLADFDAALAGPRPRWHLLADDLRRGFVDIAWDHLVDRGLAPAPDERSFIDRDERRCPDCKEPAERGMEPACARCDGTGHELFERRCERPPSLRAALVLAAADLPAAEALARDAAVRLWPWRGRRGALPRPSEPPRAIAWRVDERGGPLELMRRTRGVCPLLYEALVRAGRRRSGGRVEHWDLEHMTGSRGDLRPTARWSPHPDRDQRAARLYDELAAAGEIVTEHYMPSSRRHPYPPSGRPFAELPNPLTPLCELWTLGVAVERLETDTIVLARLA
jgi:hypothetical protein